MSMAFVAPLSTRCNCLEKRNGLGVSVRAPRLGKNDVSLKRRRAMQMSGENSIESSQPAQSLENSAQCSTVLSYLTSRAKSDTQLLLNQLNKLPRTIATTAIILSLLTGTIASAPPSALADFPETAPTAYFYDESNLVNKGASNLLTNALTKINQRTGYNVKLALVRSIPYGTGPQEYAEQLYKNWNLGSKDMVIVAGIKVARAGLAAGDDVARLLPRDVAESICNETYALRAGEEAYSSAVLDVSNRLVPILNGETDPGPPDLSTREVISSFKSKAETEKQKGKYTTIVTVLLIAAFVLPMVQYYWYVRDK